MFRGFVIALASSAAIACASPASADVIYNLTFNKFVQGQGTVQVGSGALELNFSSLAATHNIGNPSGTSLAPFLVSITTTNLDGNGMFSITPANLLSGSLFQTGNIGQIFTLTAEQSGSGAQSVLFLDLFTNAWQLHNGSAGGGTADQGSFTIAGPTLVATPLPGALPLFASGGALLGLLGWRRKRKLAA
jgi:hypothetical protein